VREGAKCTRSEVVELSGSLRRWRERKAGDAGGNAREPRPVITGSNAATASKRYDLSSRCSPAIHGVLCL
jgi:hypothetical protein